MKKSSLLVQKLNSAFEKDFINFSTIVLKPSDPYVLLIKDHSHQGWNDFAQVHDELTKEVEAAIRLYYIELEDIENFLLFEEVFISPAQLYSPYHYLVSFI